MSAGAVWINGAFVDRSEARIGAFDAAFQHAVGLFETMLAIDSEVVDLGRHLERLAESARVLRLTESLRVPAISEAVEVVVARAALSRARVRLTVTGGDLNLLSRGAGPVDPTVLIDVRPATSYPEAMYENGIVVTIADRRENPLDPFAGHKTLNYWPLLAELQKASAQGADEAVTLQVSNYLAGGCVSNLFVVKDDQVLTPVARGEEDPGAMASPVLPGITRGRVVEWALSQEHLVETRMLTIDDLLDADEVFLTNSTWGVLPVRQVEQRAIGSGAPGAVARSMLERWRQEWSR